MKLAKRNEHADHGSRGPASAVVEVVDGATITARVGRGRSARVVQARLAAAGYEPTPGDRVLVVDGDEGAFVIGVLHAATSVVRAPDGATARLVEGAMELRDPEGRLLVRYADGSAQIVAPEGDLTLAAPSGRVIVRSGEGIELDAVGAIDVRAARVGVETDATEVTVRRQATFVAGRISTAAHAIVQSTERFELSATKLVERTRDVFRDASGLAQTRVGRARMIVEDALAIYAKRTTLESKEETSIDGSRVLLG